jgi:hypothetical protein
LVVELCLAKGLDVVWSCGGAPTVPPVALLHRHVGRSFENEPPEQAAWLAADAWASRLPADVAKPLTMYRPTSHDSRLSSTYDRLELPHVEEVSERPDFLAPCKRLFVYGDAWAIDVSGVLRARPDVSWIGRVHGLKETGAKGWRVEHDSGRDEFDVVVLAAGLGSNEFVTGLPLKARPGELAVVERPQELPADVAVSRNGHLAPGLDGETVCVGATYRDRDAAPRPLEQTANACRDGVARSVPSLMSAPARSSWFGVRAVVYPDRRPLAGPTGLDGLWLATGLASKGMLWGARTAEIVVDGILGLDEPPPATDPRRVGPIGLAPGQS